MRSRLCLLATFPLLAACSGSGAEPLVPSGPNGPAGAPRPVVLAPLAAPHDVDPVGSGLTVEGVKHVCDDHLEAAAALVLRLKQLKGAPAERLTYEDTLGV